VSFSLCEGARIETGKKKDHATSEPNFRLSIMAARPWQREARPGLYVPYRFAQEPLFERITQLGGEYPEKLAREDVPEEKRVAKRVLKASWSCPFSDEELEAFRTVEQGSETWREMRNLFLSASRFPVIGGEFPLTWERGTPLDFWRESTGRLPPQVFGEQAMSFMAHGKYFEPIARSVYDRLVINEERGDVPLIEEGLRVENRSPYLYSASPDGVGIYTRDDQVIEIKCRAIGGLYKYPPYYYVPQIMGTTAIFEKKFSDFVGYWARRHRPERFMVAIRMPFNELYWERMRLRLDYMAFCVIQDRPPLGMNQLKLLYPLPKLEIEDLFFYEGHALYDDDPTAPLLSLVQPFEEDYDDKYDRKSTAK
jgi:hypothetical protein